MLLQAKEYSVSWTVLLLQNHFSGLRSIHEHIRKEVMYGCYMLLALLHFYLFAKE
jgi:hypothetical protein